MYKNSQKNVPYRGEGVQAQKIAASSPNNETNILYELDKLLVPVVQAQGIGGFANNVPQLLSRIADCKKKPCSNILAEVGLQMPGLYLIYISSDALEPVYIAATGQETLMQSMDRFKLDCQGRGLQWNHCWYLFIPTLYSLILASHLSNSKLLLATSTPISTGGSAPISATPSSSSSLDSLPIQESTRPSVKESSSAELATQIIKNGHRQVERLWHWTQNKGVPMALTFLGNIVPTEITTRTTSTTTNNSQQNGTARPNQTAAFRQPSHYSSSSESDDDDETPLHRSRMRRPASALPDDD